MNHTLPPLGIIALLACFHLTLAPLNAAAADPSDSPAAQSTGMTVRLELFVKDTHVSADFYSRILGFQCDSDTGSYIHAKNGAVRIGICDEGSLAPDHHFSQEALKGRKGIGAEIVLEVDDFEAFYQRVVETGYPVHEGMTKRPWGLHDFRLVDPDGYYLRITEKRAAAVP